MKFLKQGLIWLVITLFAGWMSNYFYDQTKNVPILKYVTGALNCVWNTIIGFLNYDVKVYSILLTLLLIFIVIIVYGNYKESKQPKPPVFAHYTVDVFKDWISTWKWFYNKKEKYWYPGNLTPLCPIDETPIIDESTIFETKAKCPKCGKRFGTYYDEYESAFETKILIETNVKKGYHPNYNLPSK